MEDQLQPYMVSFLIGLLIGIDRERSLPAGLKGLGVRTFILVALMGTIVRELNDTIFTVIISTFVLTAILSHYLATKRKKNETIGLTTGLAASAVYCLGYITPVKPTLGAAIGGAILITLIGRKWLHDFAKEKLLPKEIKAAATMVILALCVILFLPNKTVDPWGYINPRIFGILVSTIAGLQFLGYVAIRIFGSTLGIILMGFFGGLVSSTAVFATLIDFVKSHKSQIKAATVAGTLATVAMLLEHILVLLVAEPRLVLSVIIPVSAMIGTGLIASAIFFTHQKSNNELPTISQNPLDLKSVLTITSAIALMVVLISAAKALFGVQAVQIISFIGALFELHSVVIANATLFATGKLSLIETRQTILLALLATFITKFFLLWTLDKKKEFALKSSLILSLMVIVGSLATVFTPIIKLP